jgi:hypothetical protein
VKAKDRFKRVALEALQGIGAANLGEWHEWTGVAYHVRRRLTVDEQLKIGPACDLRGTDEGQKRLDAIRGVLPRRAYFLALDELRTA